jgi:hypothetical protein
VFIGTRPGAIPGALHGDPKRWRVVARRAARACMDGTGGPARERARRAHVHQDSPARRHSQGGAGHSQNRGRAGSGSLSAGAPRRAGTTAWLVRSCPREARRRRALSLPPTPRARRSRRERPVPQPAVMPPPARGGASVPAKQRGLAPTCQFPGSTGGIRRPRAPRPRDRSAPFRRGRSVHLDADPRAARTRRSPAEGPQVVDLRPR